MTDEFKEIEIKQIKSLENIRTRIKTSDVQELMQNIKQQGLLQPIGVWATPKNEYVIAYGNRRMVACEKLGWKTITAKILDTLSFEELLLVNTSENLHRKEITVAEFGRVCNLLRDKGLSKGEISIRLGVPVVRVNTAISNFKKIPEKHRKDIVFMKGGERRKMGKIPANMFNSLMSMQQELALDTASFDKLMDAVKKEDLSLSQMKVVGILLRDGATINEAFKKLDKYNVRRISLPLSKKVEQEILKDNNLKGSGHLAILFKKILTGEIQGRKDLVFEGKKNGKNGKKKPMNFA